MLISISVTEGGNEMNKTCRDALERVRKRRRERQASIPAPNTPLTEEQVEKWRIMLTTILGPYAFIMPDKEIQKFRNVFQKKIDEAFPEGGK